MNYRLKMLALIILGLIPQGLHSIPSIKQMLEYIKPIQTPKISLSQAKPWIGAFGFASTSWIGWNWYQNRAQKAQMAQAENEERKRRQELDARFQELMNKSTINNNHDLLLHSVIAGFIYKPESYTQEFAEYVYDKVMAAHCADDRNNPSPLALINKRFATGKLPLELAAEQANVAAVKWLLKKGANPLMKIRIKINNEIGIMQLSKLVALAKNRTNNPDGIERYSKILSDLSTIDALDTSALSEDEIESLDCAQQCRDHYAQIL